MRLMPTELTSKIFKGTYHKVEGFHVLRPLKAFLGKLQRILLTDIVQYKLEMVFSYQNSSDLLCEKNILVIKKNLKF